MLPVPHQVNAIIPLPLLQGAKMSIFTVCVELGRGFITHNDRVYKHHQVGPGNICCPGSKQFTDDRDITQQGDFLNILANRLLNQAAQHHHLRIVNHHDESAP